MIGDVKIVVVSADRNCSKCRHVIPAGSNAERHTVDESGAEFDRSDYEWHCYPKCFGPTKPVRRNR